MRELTGAFCFAHKRDHWSQCALREGALPRIVSSSHKFRTRFIVLVPANLVALISFRFISSRFVLSLISVSSHFILFYTARGRPRYDARKRAHAISDVFSLPCIFFPSSTALFIRRFAPAERGAPTEGEEGGGEVLGFTPVVNNIFIAASSEKRGVRKCNSEGCLPLPGTPLELLQGTTRL